jgi:CheY-like chemotaxis protein
MSAGAEGKSRLLLVEDHVDSIDALAWLLRRTGYEVTTAANGRDALAAAERESFDAIVSDIGLADMSGLELMQELRRRHRIRGISISGLGTPEDRTRSQEAGFSEHLVKPVRIEELRAALQRLAAAQG